MPPALANETPGITAFMSESAGFMGMRLALVTFVGFPVPKVEAFVHSKKLHLCFGMHA